MCACDPLCQCPRKTPFLFLIRLVWMFGVRPSPLPSPHINSPPPPLLFFPLLHFLSSIFSSCFPLMSSTLLSLLLLFSSHLSPSSLLRFSLDSSFSLLHPLPFSAPLLCSQLLYLSSSLFLSSHSSCFYHPSPPFFLSSLSYLLTSLLSSSPLILSPLLVSSLISAPPFCLLQLFSLFSSPLLPHHTT